MALWVISRETLQGGYVADRESVDLLRYTGVLCTHNIKVAPRQPTTP